MDLMDVEGISPLISSIGTHFAGSFIIADDCKQSLQGLLNVLCADKSLVCNVRRQLLNADIIPKTLFPLMCQLIDDSDAEHEDKWTIIHLTIKLMMYLTIDAHSLKTAQHGLHQIADLLTNVKHDFCEIDHIRGLFKHVLILSERSGKSLTAQDTDTLDCWLFLLRNVLFLPDDHPDLEAPKLHIILLDTFFKAGLTEILMNMLVNENQNSWCMAMAQLIALLYKEKELDGEEKNERNASMNISTPTTASSYTTWSRKRSHECSSNTCKSFSSDSNSDGCPYAMPSEQNHTSLIVEGSGSNNVTPENDDKSPTDLSNESNSPDLFIKPAQMEAERKHVNMCMLELQHEINIRLIQLQVRNQLGTFSKEFIMKGLTNLVHSIQCHLLGESKTKLPELYFTWMVGHFLNWAHKLDIPFKYFRGLLSHEVLGYVAYLGAFNCEQVLVAAQQKKETVTAVCHSHLIVSTFHKVFRTLEFIGQQELTDDEKSYLQELKTWMVQVSDISDLLLLLIRQYQPNLHPLDYLKDAITANHKFLIVAEEVLPSLKSQHNFDMLRHISKFAHVSVMHQYGCLLRKFEENSAEINDCLFTMMYHVAGDCLMPHTLLQLPILKTFTKIWDTNMSLPVEWHDLMNYVLQHFMCKAADDPYQCAQYLFAKGFHDDDDQLSDDSCKDEIKESWTDEEKDILFSCFCDAEEGIESSRLLSTIITALEDKGYKRNSSEVIIQLGIQNLWNDSERHQDASSASVYASKDEEEEIPDTLDLCVKKLNEEGFGEHLSWLQSLLLEAAYIKLGGHSLHTKWIPEEPITLYYCLQNKSLPIIPYTATQSIIMKYNVFDQLLQLLGFHMPPDSCLIWPRIPNFWDPEVLISKAKQIGMIDHFEAKFSENHVEQYKQVKQKWLTQTTPESERIDHLQPSTSNTSVSYSRDLWQMFIQHCSVQKKVDGTTT